MDEQDLPPLPARDIRFDPENLVKTVIAVPLLRAIEANAEALYWIIVDINIRYIEGREAAQAAIFQLIERAIADSGSNPAQKIQEAKSQSSSQYVYAHLQGKVIRRVVELDAETGRTGPEGRCIHHIWPDFVIRPLIWKSVATVKADACRRAFATSGNGIVWAVLDSGIDATHPHFRKHKNLQDLPSPVQHMDFTVDPPVAVALKDLNDDYGHGTHVAGIIAGELEESGSPVAIMRERDPHDKIAHISQPMPSVVGVAPETKLVSFQVITGEDGDPVSNVIAALEEIQRINANGRQIIIHGVNLSLGYDFEAEWFACGQSPVCVEVDRLVKSGVSVVVAAGNTGKGFSLTINDPGNSELAITVGSTHRDMPHTYGVSYFSSKGPTGDGRRKPDLLAPGERILSCGAGPDLEAFKKRAGVTGPGAYYIERTGTSMSAPHVSGIVAGLLSVRTEFIGKPEQIKQYLMNTATTLGRDRYFEGCGLVDMMRAIQAI